MNLGHLISTKSYAISDTVSSMKKWIKNRILLTCQTASDGRALWRAHQAPRRAPAPTVLNIGFFSKSMLKRIFISNLHDWHKSQWLTWSNPYKYFWLVTNRKQKKGSSISSQKKSLVNRAKHYNFQFNFYELQIICHERTKASSKRQKKVFCDFDY